MSTHSRHRIAYTSGILSAILVPALLGACGEEAAPSQQRTEDVPAIAALEWSQDGSQPFYVWQVVDGEVVPVDDVDIVATVLGAGPAKDASLAADTREGAGGADELAGAESDDDGDHIVVWYAGEGIAPEMAFEFTPRDDVKPRATAVTQTNGLRINFLNFGYKAIKSRPTGGTATSKFFNKSTSGASWTTLYGPTTYSSCTYAYNCKGPYGMGVRTSWNSGSRTITYTMRSHCSVSC